MLEELLLPDAASLVLVVVELFTVLLAGFVVVLLEFCLFVVLAFTLPLSLSLLLGVMLLLFSVPLLFTVLLFDSVLLLFTAPLLVPVDSCVLRFGLVTVLLLRPLSGVVLFVEFLSIFEFLSEEFVVLPELLVPVFVLDLLIAPEGLSLL